MKEIVIKIEGGVAQPLLPLPDDILVELRIYDCAAFEAHELRTDNSGKKCAILRYVGGGLSESSVIP
jgi:hypothetical protein